MKEYRVVFATSFIVDAPDENIACEIAEERFKKDLGKESIIQLGNFGVHVEELED